MSILVVSMNENVIRDKFKTRPSAVRKPGFKVPVKFSVPVQRVYFITTLSPSLFFRHLIVVLQNRHDCGYCHEREISKFVNGSHHEYHMDPEHLRDVRKHSSGKHVHAMNVPLNTSFI